MDSVFLYWLQTHQVSGKKLQSSCLRSDIYPNRHSPEVSRVKTGKWFLNVCVGFFFFSRNGAKI